MPRRTFTVGFIQQALEKVYHQALAGWGPFDSAEKLARDYQAGPGSLSQQVDRLIAYQCSKSFVNGAVTSLGGLAENLVMLPANITVNLFIQLRMIAAIAILGGYAADDDRVQTLGYVCLVGNEVKDVLKEVGIQFGKKLTERVIKQAITRDVVTKVNQKVGMRLVTKFGSKGLVNLGRAIPLVGGLVGGTVDLLWTRSAGKAAKRVFITST